MKNFKVTNNDLNNWKERNVLDAADVVRTIEKEEMKTFSIYWKTPLTLNYEKLIEVENGKQIYINPNFKIPSKLAKLGTFTGIKNAVGVAKRWEEQDNRYRAHIMVDLSDNTVWCDTFTSCNSWASYTSNTVHCVTGILLSVLQLHVSQKNIQKAIDYIIEEERRKASERES